MNQALQARCEMFIKARDTIKNAFRWESGYITPVCANLFCARDILPEEDRLRACRDRINQSTGIFSSFRGYIRTPLACMLSMEANPEGKLRQALDMYQALKQHFFGSDYLALAAFLLTDYDCTEERLSRGKRLYRMMKDEHPFLTSSEDSVFAVLMAWSGQSDSALIADMEACYRILRDRFRDSDCVQTVTHILAMEEGAASDKCGRVFELYDAVGRQGGKYGKHYELPTLAALAMLKGDPEELARGMMEADGFLAAQKGYGFWGIGRKTRLMHAAMIVSDGLVPNGAVDRAALTGTLSLVIAQQIAMFAAMASAAAASSAASSSH